MPLFAPIDRWRAPAPDPAKVSWIGEADYAHRGLFGPGVPENSLAAFGAAVDRGYGIELDIQRSSDGHAIVFHDWDLERLTGATGPVMKQSAEALGKLALGGTGETVPTLRAVLDLVGGRVPVLIEIKSKRDLRVGPLCLAVRRVLEGYRGPHGVMSFDPRVSRWFATHSPHTVRGLSYTEGEDKALPGMIRRRLALWHARPDFLCYDIRDLPGRFPASQRRRGLPLVTWTIASAEHLERAEAHADAAIVEGPAIR